MRHDFASGTKELLSKRAGMRCSNPNCRQLTCGPQDDPSGAVNVGVAAHVSGASPGGPRYDARMRPEDRSSSENGIWLCQTCAKLIDSDVDRYTVDLLREWRRASERAAQLEVESGRPQSHAAQDDRELLRFYAQCFDRPAFQDHFHEEGSMEAFDRAIEDTITAINTGCLRSRDGTVLQRARGKAYLERPDWREAMDAVVEMLRAIRARYEFARTSGEIHVRHETSDRDVYHIRDHAIAEWMDRTRDETLRLFGRVCEKAGIKPPPPLMWHGRPRW